MKSNQVKFLLTLFGMAVFINLVSQSYEISQETYRKYFPLESQSAIFEPTTDYVCILPTNEVDEKLQNEVNQHYKDEIISKLPTIPNQVRKIVTDKEALKMNLSGTHIYAFGSVEGNLWISDFMNKTKVFPIKITKDSIVADKSYVGNDMLLKALWINPYDPKYSLTLNIPQNLSAAKSVKYKNTSQFAIWKGEKVVNFFNRYYFDENKWYFLGKGDTLLSYKGRRNNKPNPRVLEMFYEKYPTEKQVEDCEINSKDIPYDAINIEHINNNFDNIDDLTWLKPIANKYKIITIGENHYQNKSQILFERILFAINSYDHFKTLILELPYSLTGYYNYYLDIEDEKTAQDFYNKEIGKLPYSSLIKNIRKWNKKNPDNTINIGCSDIEHDLERTLVEIINPYLETVGSKTKLDSLYKRDLFKYSDLAKAILKEGKRKNIVGKYPFITPRYLESVVDNFKSSLPLKLYKEEYRDLKERYKFIIKNLTDDKFLGKKIKENKCILYGNKNHFVIRESENETIKKHTRYDSEGYFLANKFEKTKNRVYSIQMSALALSITDTIPLNNSVYASNSKHPFIRFYKKGVINLNEPIISPCPDDFDRYVFKLSYKHKNSAFRIKEIKVDDIMNKYEGFKRYWLNRALYEVVNFDTYIAIPYSSIE